MVVDHQGRGGAQGGGFSDFFESLFARQRGAGPRPGAGPQPRGDTRAKLAVPLEAVYRGDSVRINLNGRQLEVKVPKDLDPSATSALRAYAQAEKDSGFDPRAGWAGL